MMKTMKIAAWTVGIAVLFLSCAKQAEFGESGGTVSMAWPEVPVLVHDVGPGNPGNPLDSIGTWHNEILDYIYANGLQVCDCGETGVIGELVSDYMEQRWQFPLVPEPLSLPVPEDDDIGPYLDGITESAGFSPHAAQLFRQLLETVAVSGGMGTSFSYAVFRETVTGLETQIAGDDHIADSERQALLAAASVARHSMFYWTNGGQWPEIVPAPEDTGNTGRLTFKRIVRFVGTVTADMWGAAWGMTVNPYYAAGKAASDSANMHTAISWCMPGEL